MFGIERVHLKRRESNDIPDETQSKIMIQRMPISFFRRENFDETSSIHFHVLAVSHRECLVPVAAITALNNS
jgi:hypothetical protein